MPVIASASAGPEEPRPLGIDHDAQETTQRLRDGVVTRAVRVGTGAAKAADGAVDETRVERTQPLDACPQPVCGARPEVLYVDVRLANQLVKDLAVVRPVEVERQAALVAVVRLEMR